MRANPDCAISQTDEIWIRNGRRVNPGLRHRKRAGDIFIDSLRTCLISMSAAMMRTDLFRSLGGFDEIMMAAEDYDLWLRILIDHEAGLLDEPLVTRRGGHPDQTSATTPAIDRFRILALTKLLADDRLSAVRGELRWSKCSPRNAASTPAASRDEAESIRLVSTNGSLTRRKTGALPRSVALSDPSDRRFTKFHMNADEIDAQIRELAAERRAPVEPSRSMARDGSAVARRDARHRAGFASSHRSVGDRARHAGGNRSARADRRSPPFSSSPKFGALRTARARRRRARARCWKHCERFGTLS